MIFFLQLDSEYVITSCGIDNLTSRDGFLDVTVGVFEVGSELKEDMKTFALKIPYMVRMLQLDCVDQAAVFWKKLAIFMLKWKPEAWSMFKIYQLNRDSNFRHMNFDYVDFSRILLSGLDFSGCSFKKSNMFGCDLSHSVFENACLEGANIQKAILNNANFTSSDLRGIKISEFTVIGSETWPDLSNCKVSRDALVVLKEKGLSNAQLVTMQIEDNLADLQREFGGIWGAIHLFSVLVFLAPYVYFLFYIHVNHFFWNAVNGKPVSTLEPVYKLLWCEIKEKGNENILIVISLVLLNIFRALLLFRTKKLEHEIKITGVPSSFSFSSDKLTGGAFKIMRILTWVSYILILFHVFIFMTTPVMVP